MFLPVGASTPSCAETPMVIETVERSLSTEGAQSPIELVTPGVLKLPILF